MIDRQCSPAWYHNEGIAGARCGSLARSGLPVTVFDPDTAQLLEPMPSPTGPRTVFNWSNATRVARRAGVAGRYAAAWSTLGFAF